MNVEELLKVYKRETMVLDALEQQLKGSKEALKEFVEKNIDFEEVDKKYNYLDAKELINSLGSIKHEYKTKNFLEYKKLREYPEIIGVHYFSEIKEIDWLTEEEKVNLDYILMERQNYSEVWRYDDKTIEFLMENKIIEKYYVFTCVHDCWKKYVSENRFNKLKKYWGNEELTEEEIEDCNYRCIWIDCEYDEGAYEISSLKEFEENISHICYRVIKKADMTLDKL